MIWGGASGTSNGKSFTEIQLGVNWHLNDWLLWRNSPFYRFRSDFPAAYGLDSSLIGHHTFDVAESFKPMADVGAGYRLLSTGGSAPFVEGGAGFFLGGLTVHGSVKRIFNSAMNKSRRDDTIFSLTFGGSGVIF